MCNHVNVAKPRRKYWDNLAHSLSTIFVNQFARISVNNTLKLSSSFTCKGLLSEEILHLTFGRLIFRRVYFWGTHQNFMVLKKVLNG